MTTTDEAAGYSVANAERFGWAGFAASPLPPERVAVLDGYVLGPRVLDAGCGSGVSVDHLARKGFDAVGVDVHQFCLDTAAARGYRGTFVQGDLTDGLPFADGEFDTALCCDVLEHVDDVAALAELARVARRRIVLTVPQDWGRLAEFRLLSPPYQDPTHLRYYTRESLLALAATVSPARVRVFGEQAMDMVGFAKAFVRPHSRHRLLDRVYAHLGRFLARRWVADPAFMNWCAVIDMVADEAGE